MPFPSVSSAMRYWRRKKHPRRRVKDLQQFSDLLADPEHQNLGNTRDGKPYFRRGVTGSSEEGSIAIFASPNFEELLETCPDFHVDGHFKSVPKVAGVYQQVTLSPLSFDHVSAPVVANGNYCLVFTFVKVVLLVSQVWPAVTILMTRKTKASYKMAFTCLKELFPSINIEHIMSDFEPALLAAIRECFPAVKLTGCLFHCDQVTPLITIGLVCRASFDQYSVER